MTAPAVLYNGVYLNDYYYSNMNRLERIKTTIHEIGHILRLNEFTNKESNQNVMV